MDSIVFLILRQMRVPLLVLITVYTIATLGLTLIPGQDDQGEVWYMGFFHAFYFVTIMGTTIGFGEIPYPFTDAQRMWAVVFVYITVATWIYAIGSLIQLLKNESLKSAFTEYRFRLQVTRIRDPFVIVCGYGDTGSQLVQSLRRRLMMATVIDRRQSSIDALTLTEHPLQIPSLCCNARDPHNLVLAGVTHPLCRSVVALTNNNEVNLHIAITAKVLRPSIKVICRTDKVDVAANMASFGTDHIVDPYVGFARTLGLGISAPHQYQLNEWFHSDVSDALTDVAKLPEGLWVLCGFGRCGRALYRELLRKGLTVIVIEPDKSARGLPASAVIGNGTEAVTLDQANIKHAVAIIAGSDDDANNLSIIVTAKALNPDLFTVVRQNDPANTELFAHSRAEIIMEPSDACANQIRSLLTNPLVDNFLSLARAHSDSWAAGLVEKLKNLETAGTLDVWEVTLESDQAFAVVNELRAGHEVTLDHLVHNHHDRDVALPLIALLHGSAQGSFCLPSLHSSLSITDRLLFVGTRNARSMMEWNLNNIVALNYVQHGTTLPQTTLGRWWQGRRQRSA